MYNVGLYFYGEREIARTVRYGVLESSISELAERDEGTNLNVGRDGGIMLLVPRCS